MSRLFKSTVPTSSSSSTVSTARASASLKKQSQRSSFSQRDAMHSGGSDDEKEIIPAMKKATSTRVSERPGSARVIASRNGSAPSKSVTASNLSSRSSLKPQQLDLDSLSQPINGVNNNHTSSIPSSPSRSSLVTSSSSNQMRSLLSFLDSHEETTERDQQLLSKLASPTSTNTRASPLATTGNYEVKYANGSSSSASSIAPTIVDVSPYKIPTRNQPRSSNGSNGSAASIITSPLTSSRAPTIIADSSPSSSSSTSFNDIKSNMQQMKSSIAEKEKRIEMLEKEIWEVKHHTQSQLSSQNAASSLQLTQQKSEYESTLLRHQSFIEQLLASKEELSRNIEKLNSDMEMMHIEESRRLERTIVDTDLKWTKKMELLQSQEKLKREQFITQKTKSIKELTIKGLEPEIQRIIEMNKQEMKRREEEWDVKLGKRVEEVKREGEESIQALRMSMLQEREAALDKERAYAQERYKEQMDRSDQMMQEQRTRFHEDLERQRVQLENDKSKLVNAKEIATTESRIRSLKQQHIDDLVLEKQRYDSQLSLLQSKHESDRVRMEASWKEMMIQQVKQREEELKNTLRKEQEEELNLIVSKLTQENTQQVEMLRDEHQREVTVMNRRLADAEARKKDSDVSSQSNIKSLHDEIANLQISLTDEENHSRILQNRLTACESQLQHSQGKLREYEQHESRMKDELESKYHAQINELTADRDRYLAAMREERDRSRASATELTKKHEQSLALTESKHANELESVQLRVKHMIEKKDLVIAQLRIEMNQQEKKMKEIERMLTSGN